MIALSILNGEFLAVLSTVNWNTVVEVQVNATFPHWEWNQNWVWWENWDLLGSVSRVTSWNWNIWLWQWERSWQVRSWLDIDWDSVVSEWSPDWSWDLDWSWWSDWDWLWLWQRNWLWLWHWGLWVVWHVPFWNVWVNWVRNGFWVWDWMRSWLRWDHDFLAWSIDASSIDVQKRNAVWSVQDKAVLWAVLWLSVSIIKVLKVLANIHLVSSVVIDGLSIWSKEQLAVFSVVKCLLVLVIEEELSSEVVLSLSVLLIVTVIFPGWFRELVFSTLVVFNLIVIITVIR